MYTTSPYNNVTSNISNQTFGNYQTYQSNTSNGGRLLGAPLIHPISSGNQYLRNVTETAKFGGNINYTGNYRKN